MLPSAWDITKKGLHLYRQNWKLFFQYIAILFFLTLLSTLFGSALEIATLSISGVGIVLTYIVFILLIIIVWLINFWVTITFIRVVASSYLEHKVGGLQKEMRTASSLMVPALLASFIAGAIVFGGTLLLIVPGLIFFVWYYFTFYAVSIQNQHGYQALKFSKSLVVGRWWPVSWRLILPILFLLLLGPIIAWLLITLPFGILGEYLSGPTGQTILIILIKILSKILGLILATYLTCAHIVLYIELARNPIQKPSA